ncbi:uncharacterized protein LOC124144710 [Haliotis rufescens]|uniref:uncharacterized protein LOC124144710 n=1 Tax=Haliotis rufescens TaxID=6454 RepID=UPI001EB0679F|nr:uncharacterized protein LOC124144710 [Haliotis rufescens]XP_046370205.1 uncharacterized protein LOC124144710 [Haliotis rufescens]XP_046370206.1 uncharacterized protein LOC124144710 [Haliotis rufescens]XP_048246834.1 uncharacterized protein LOC124144710 [Haliotis rufescens]
MLTTFFKRRRRASSITFLGLVAFMFLCLWNFSTMDNPSQTYVHRFRLFGGAAEEDLPSDFYKLPADDPTLVDIVRSKFRSPSTMDYNLTKPDQRDFSRGPSEVIDGILGSKENGFFVDCGAFDGESKSVTLMFERLRHWRGLLVEPNRDRYLQIVKKNRKAHSINACVRTDIENYGRPEKSDERLGYFEGRQRNDVKAVPCFWLTTLLLATGQKTVDLLSLDLNSKEMALLQTIDFDRINVKSISLEIPISYEGKSIITILDYMKLKGFSAMHQFTDHIHKTKDLVLKKTN